MKMTNVDDYLDMLQKLYPEVPREDIKRIVQYGWRLYYLINSMGGDVLLTDSSGFWSYTGFLFKSSIEHFKNYIKKLAIKIRFLYRKKNVPWDGYYYFALTDAQWENYQSLQNKRGRKRKCFKYGDVMLFKILDECKIVETYKKYIFRIPYITSLGPKKYVRDLESSKAELIITREAQTFKDILVSENNYEIL